jgi:hypothetical protein
MPSLADRLKAQERLIAVAEDRLSRALAELEVARSTGRETPQLQKEVEVCELSLKILRETHDALLAEIQRERSRTD